MAARIDSRKEFDYCFKVVILGEYKVGKTSLLFRYTDECFDNSLNSTLGVDFRMKTLHRCDKQIKLQIWDTGGSERFRSQVNNYYRGANGVLLVYDVTDRHSFENLGYWVSEIHQNCIPYDPCVILIGNKCHLGQFREVLAEEGQEYAASLEIPFFETSAEQNINVTSCFEWLVTQMIAAEELRRTKQDSKSHPGFTDDSFQIVKKSAATPREQISCTCI